MVNPSIKDRIIEKIKEIENYLEQLESILPNDFKEYSRNWEKRVVCERCFEKIVEAVEDLSFLIINKNELKYPEYEKEVFDILKQNKIISDNLCLNLKHAKGMRNIIAHQYGKIDNELVFEAITEQLGKDVRELIKNIENLEK